MVNVVFFAAFNTAAKDPETSVPKAPREPTTLTLLCEHTLTYNVPLSAKSKYRIFFVQNLGQELL